MVVDAREHVKVVQTDSAFEDSGRSDSDVERTPNSKAPSLLKVPVATPVRGLPRIRRGRWPDCFITRTTNMACDSHCFICFLSRMIILFSALTNIVMGFQKHLIMSLD